MKKLKFLYFIFVLAICCPLFFIGCGKVNFDDVPYTSTSEEVSSVLEKISDAKTIMLAGENLKMKYETTNTYTFFDTIDKKVSSKVITDKYITNIGIIDENGFEISSITMTRKVDDEETFTLTQTYVSKYEKGDEIYSYLYLNNAMVTVQEEVKEIIEYKDRISFNSNYFTNTSFFNSAVVDVDEQEIDKVYKKTYEGSTYYRLDSVLNGLEVCSDRFVKDENLQLNPNLFTCLDPSYDSILSMSYEYGINSSSYINYSRIKYEIAQNGTGAEFYNEKYLEVDSVSRLVGFGHNLLSANIPENAEDYTAQSFVNTMLNGDFQLVFKDVDGSEYTKTTLIKSSSVNNENNFEQSALFTDNVYNAIIEKVGKESSTKKYFIKLDGDVYKSYLVDEISKKYQEVAELPVDVTAFNFINAELNNKQVNEEEKTITYTYNFGEGQANTLTIVIKDNEVYKVTISKDSNSKDYYIVSFKSDIENLRILTSLEGLEEGVLIEAPEEDEESK